MKNIYSFLSNSMVSILLIGLFLVSVAGLSAAAPLSVAAGMAANVPAAADTYKLEQIRIAQSEFGLNAPAARLAAQIHQESHWRPDVSSPYADGLTQFTPATAEWIAEIYPELYPADVWDPGWSMLAQAFYMKRLLQGTRPWQSEQIEACDRWAMALSSYNGGGGNLNRDRRLALAAGANPDQWFGHVENHSPRADWAFKENRHYPKRILYTLEPRYRQAGWPGEPVC